MAPAGYLYVEDKCLSVPRDFWGYFSNWGTFISFDRLQEAITIGNRTITSVIRLKSGESSLLAGLIRRDTTKGVTKTPLLGDIPLLGRLFRTESLNKKDTDLVLTLTPQIIRFPDIEEDEEPLYLLYNDFVNTMTQQPELKQLLPVEAAEDEELKAHWDYIYEPDSKPVMDALMIRYIESLVYQGVVENVACEQAARMVAMKAASDNANDLIDSLVLSGDFTLFPPRGKYK